MAVSCEALAAPAGPTMRVTPAEADMLPAIVAAAPSGTTILLADGTYRMTTSGESARRIQFRTDGVTLRSESNDAEAVIIDGEYLTNEILAVHASNVTIAHLTVTRAVDHPIHVTPMDGTTNVTGFRAYAVRLVDGGEQFLKVNPNGARSAWVDTGTVECSTFLMTDAGRPHVERAGGGCYTGGIDTHAAQGWVVRNNHFEGIYCAGEGLAEHAIHFWNACRDTLVENNVIVDCARGIGFGLGEMDATRPYADDPFPGIYVGHYGGIIRNNVISAEIPYFDTGIELSQARGTVVVHNTVWSTDAVTSFFSSIDYRFPNSDVTILNNLVRRITVRDGAMGRVESNQEGVDASYFVDAPGDDFHLVAGATMAIDRGVAHPDSGLDLDGDPHSAGSAPDLGADERM